MWREVQRAAVILTVGCVGSAEAALSTDAVARTLNASFARCGSSPTLNHSLSLAAADLLRGDELNVALKRQKFLAYASYSVSMTYNGDAAWLKEQMAQRCGKLTRYKAFGLAVDGARLRVVFSTEAQVDLSQSRRWMAAFLKATNRARSQGQKCGAKLMNAVPPLRWNIQLAGAAAQHAREMVRLNFRGHVHPVDGRQAQQRAAALGFVGRAGENIAYGPMTAQEAVTNLLKSPEHCKNLMDAHWTLFGSGVANGTVETLFTTYWVQVFGTVRR